MGVRVSGICLAAILMTAPAWAGGVKQQIEYKHYAVEGASALQVINSMLRAGPDYGGAHAYATTQVDVEPAMSRSLENGCRAEDLTLNARFTITLPRHGAPGQLGFATRRQYERLVGILKAHELEHQRIFRGCLDEMHKQIMALPPARSCAAFSRQVRAISDREWARCKVLNQALDDRDGARHDELPLIADALREAAQAQARAAFAPTRAPRETGRRIEAMTPSGDPSELVVNQPMR